jgi:hypothetical protein
MNSNGYNGNSINNTYKLKLKLKEREKEKEMERDNMMV